MIRKFNYTNRKKIPLGNIEISINEIGENFYFIANIRKEGLDFPGEAKVYIEPFYGPDSLRFDFGVFSNIRQPENTDITELKRLSDKIYFHLKVVDDSTENGLLLGDAKIYDLLNDKNPKAKSSILYVNPIKMDTREIWRVNFTGEDGMPVLEVNNEIEGIFEITKCDPIFISLVYPSAIRQILRQIISEGDFDWIGDNWNSKWISFTRRILNVLDTPLDSGDEEICDDWVENVIREFCTRHKLFENYLKKINV